MTKEEFLKELLEELNKQLWAVQIDQRYYERVNITEPARKVSGFTIPDLLVRLKREIKQIEEKQNVILDELKDLKK